MRTSPPSPHAADSTSGWSDFWDRTVGQTVAGRWGGETADGVEGVDGRNQGTTPRHTLCVECTYWDYQFKGKEKALWSHTHSNSVSDGHGGTTTETVTTYHSGGAVSLGPRAAFKLMSAASSHLLCALVVVVWHWHWHCQPT